MTTEATKAAFLSPFDFGTPEGAEGWEDMYAYYVRFGPERQEFDEGKFWFCNTLHFPEPLPPFDMIAAEACYMGIGQFQSRTFSIPNVLGIEHRVLNGYVYITANQETDPEVIGKRLEVFQRRAGHYYANWDELEKNWRNKVLETINASEAIVVPDLPGARGRGDGHQGPGIGSNYRLIEAFDRIMEGYYKINQLHFELHLLGFGAYLVFFQFCQRRVPGHLRADDEPDDLGPRLDLLPARRRAEGRWPGSRSRRAWRRSSPTGATSTRSSRRSRRPTPARSGSASSSRARSPGST